MSTESLRPARPYDKQTRKNESAALPIGTARATLAASLGKKLRAIAAMLEGKTFGDLDALDAASAGAVLTSAEGRIEARKALRALSLDTEKLKLDVLSRGIADVLGQLDRGDPTPRILTAIEELPSLVWGDGASARQAPRPTLSRAALFYATSDLTSAFKRPNANGEVYACDSTVEIKRAKRIAKEFAIQLLVVDGDLPHAADLVGAVLDDPDTESTPIVVVSSFEQEADRAHYVALGVQVLVQKPASPEALRREADTLCARVDASSPSDPIGDCSVEELAFRLAEELRRELCQTGAASRTDALAFGEGADVLGPFWGAIARIREVISARSNGAIRYEHRGPAGSQLLMPNLEMSRSQAQRQGEGEGFTPRGGRQETSLKGMRVLVADDDPAVTWFLSDILREAGCLVDEVLDGEAALNRAFATAPDLIISDIIMPKMDGLALCRTLRADVRLGDRPVLLLSWKEDLLHRVRELGVRASGYLRKESDAHAVLSQVREALRIHIRVNERLAEIQTDADGMQKPVMGRLDGILAGTLIQRVAASRGTARITLRDASHLYEVELAECKPVRAVRTGGTGEVLIGLPVLLRLLSVSSGRFWVDAGTASCERNLDDTVEAELAKEIAQRRSIARGLRIGHLTELARLNMSTELAGEFCAAAPPMIRDLVGRLMLGDSPRALIMQGQVESSMLEDVLRRLAVCGAIATVRDVEGNDLSVPLVLPDLSALEVDGELRSALPPQVLPKPSASPTARTTPAAPSATLSVLPPIAHASERTEPHNFRVPTSVDGTLYGGRDSASMNHQAARATAALEADANEDSFSIQVDLASNLPSAVAMNTDLSPMSASSKLTARQVLPPADANQDEVLGCDDRASEAALSEAALSEAALSDSGPQASSFSLPPVALAKKRKGLNRKSVHAAIALSGTVAVMAFVAPAMGVRTPWSEPSAGGANVAAPVSVANQAETHPNLNVTVEYTPVAQGKDHGKENVEVRVEGPWLVKVDGNQLAAALSTTNTAAPSPPAPNTAGVSRFSLSQGMHRVVLPEARREWTFEARPGFTAVVRVYAP
jgi:DNA-binding response OmpR family regulator